MGTTFEKDFQPYVGPRPFQRADRVRFFGREPEASDLVSLVIADSTLLVYSQSGAGKSSLLNAKVVPTLEEEEECDVLLTARVGNPLPEGLNTEEVRNVFVFNSLLCWSFCPDCARNACKIHSQRIDPRELLQRSLPDYLKARSRRKRKDGADSLRVAIFDQFEELFTSYPDRWADRKTFFQQLKEALAADSLLRVIFAMREEYVARLEPYVSLLPDKLRTRFRLERLRERAAESAISKPLEGSRYSYRDGVVKELVNELRAVEYVAESGEKRPATTEFVEPVQLGVVCETLWQQLPPDVTEITAEHVQTYGNVNEALSAFYENCLHEAVSVSGVEERVLRSWFQHRLITPEGKRGSRYKGATQTDGVPNAAIDVLERMHLIHSEWRGDSSWCELPHDRFVRPILESNKRWLSERLKPDQVRLRDRLEDKASEWERKKRNTQALLDENNLLKAEGLLASPVAEEIGFSESLRALVEASQRERQQRQLTQARKSARRMRTLAVALAGMTAIAAFLAVRAWRARARAMDAYRSARSAESLANQLRQTADQNAAEANQQRQKADQSAAAAKDSERIARGLAGQMKQLARSRQLAAAAVNSLGVDPERSLLLALQAVDIADNAGGSASDDLEDTLRRAVHTSRERLKLDTYGTPPEHVAFSPDGNRLATAHFDGTVRVWDARSGRELLALCGHARGVNSLAFDRTGVHLATASEDGTARIWEAQTGRLLLTLTGHADKIQAVDFSPDGRKVATASEDGTAKLWDAQTGRLLLTLSGHMDTVEAVAFSPDGTKVATASTDSTAIVWDARTGNPVLTLKPNAQLKAIAFQPDGSRVATAGYAGSVDVWDATSGSHVHSLSGHTNAIFDMNFSADGTRIATASYDGTVKVWDTDSGRELFTLAGHTEAVSGVAFDAAGTRLATASWDGTVRLWSFSSEEGPVLDERTGAFNDVAFSPDGTRLATASSDGTARLWDAGSGQPVHTFNLPGRVLGIALSPNGKRLAATSSDSIARVWDLTSERDLFTLKGHQGTVEQIAFSPDGRYLATAGSDRTAKLWDAASGGHIRDFEGHTDKVRAVAFHRDGKRLATASEDGTAIVWRIDSGQKLATLKHVAVMDVTFSPDGKRLATAGKDKTVKLWDVDSGKLLKTLSGHTDTVMHVAFSPDSRLIATASSDRSVKLWDASTGREARTIAQTTAEPESLAFSSDGQRLAVAGNDGVARIYLLSFKDLLNLARSHVTRPLTADECRTFLTGPCPVTPLGLRAEGRQLAKKGEREPALIKLRQSSHLDRSLGLDPEKEADAWLSAVAIRAANQQIEDATSEEDFQKAFQLLDAARRFDPAMVLDPKIEVTSLAACRLVDQGRDLARKGNVAEASRRFQSARSLDSSLVLDPDEFAKRLRAQSLLAQGREFVANGQTEDALGPLEEAVSTYPQDIAAYQLLATIYEAQQEFDKAIQWLQKAVEVAPSRPDLERELGEAFLAKADYPRAADLARKALDLNPNYGCAHVLLGQAERLMKQYDGAIRAFDLVQDTDPCYGDATSSMAQIYFDDLHQYELAYQVYMRALTQNPSDVNNVSNFAEASLASGRFREAYRLAGKALAGPPEVSEAPGISVSLAMRFITVASLLLQDRSDDADGALRALLDYYNSNISDYKTPEWSYRGSENFIRRHSMPESSRKLLLKLLEILQKPAGPVRLEQLTSALTSPAAFSGAKRQ